MVGGDGKFDVVGVKTRVVGMQLEVKARIGVSAVEQIASALALEVPGAMEYCLDGIPNRAWADAYRRHRKLVATIDGALSSVPRVPGLTGSDMAVYGRAGREAVAEADRHMVDARVQRESAAARRAEVVTKKYKLSHFLSDVDVIAKYDVPAAYMQIVRRAAVSDAARAVMLLQSHLKGRGFDVAIEVGDYAKGCKHARSEIVAAARGIPVVSLCVPMRTIGDNVFLEHELEDPEGWTVKAHVNNTASVLAVHRLCLVKGRRAVEVLLGLQMARLGIQVVPNSFHATISGLVEHVAEKGISGTTHPAGLSTAESQAVGCVAACVRGVTVAGCVVASALLVGPQVSLVNAHALSPFDQGGSVLIGGKVVERERPCGDDLWIVSHDTVSEEAETPVIRPAAVGDHAVLCYAVPHGFEYSDVVVVRAVDTGVIVTSLPCQARRGMSGAALVSCVDGALLGMYRGATRDVAVSVVVSTTQMADAVGYATRSPGAISLSPGSTTEAGSIYHEMSKRGLGRVLESVTASLVPLYVDGGTGEQLGVGVTYGSRLVTTVDATDWPLVIRGQSVSSKPGFRSVRDGVYEATVSRVVSQAYRTRLPRAQELVFVIGRDEAGGYFSEAVRVQREVVGGGSFDISALAASDLPIKGGAVVALADGSVLGLYDAVVDTFRGLRGKCYSLPTSTREPAALVATLAARYHEANVAGWPVDQVEGAFDLTEGEMRGDLARLGALALQSTVATSLAREGRGDLVSTAMDAVGDEIWLSMRALSLDLVRLATSPGDLVSSLSTRVQASLFLALLGLARTHETGSGFDEFCEELGLLEAGLYERIRVPRSAVLAPLSPWLALEGGMAMKRSSSAAP